MMRIQLALLIIFAVFSTTDLLAIPNCYIYSEDEACYKACKEAEKGIRHPQGSKASQEHFLRSIELCPEFAYSFFESAVPYAKRGQMHLWIDLIDKAVELDPENYLGRRGWCHWFFMHNYEKAIADIDTLDALVSYDIGETGDGFYHLNIMKGLCYKGLGDNDMAIQLFENCMASEDYYHGSYDNLHLGVLYLETGAIQKALDQFRKQTEYNDVSESYYYSAKAYQQLDDHEKALDLLDIAIKKYDQGMHISNPYRQFVDEIFRIQIEEAIKELGG